MSSRIVLILRKLLHDYIVFVEPIGSIFSLFLIQFYRNLPNFHRCPLPALYGKTVPGPVPFGQSLRLFVQKLYGRFSFVKSSFMLTHETLP